MPSPYASACCATAKADRPFMETHAVSLVRRAGDDDAGRRDREDGHRRDRDHERDPVLLAHEALDEPPDHAHAADVDVVSGAFSSTIVSVPDDAVADVVPVLTVRAALTAG